MSTRRPDRPSPASSGAALQGAPEARRGLVSLLPWTSCSCRSARGDEMTASPAMSRCVRRLGHANLGITRVYLQGIDSSEIIRTVHGRLSPTISAIAGLQMLDRSKRDRVGPGRRRADSPPYPRLANCRCASACGGRPALYPSRVPTSAPVEGEVWPPAVCCCCRLPGTRTRGAGCRCRERLTADARQPSERARQVPVPVAEQLHRRG